MPALLVQVRVEDYARWHKVFEESAPLRRALGATSTTILQQYGDPNNVAILFEVPDLERAKAFSASPELRQAQQRAGVVGPPSVTFYGYIERLQQQAEGVGNRSNGGWSAGEM